MDVTDVTWRTSSYTGSGGGNCVDVGSGEYAAVLTREQAEDERYSSRSSTKEPRAPGEPVSRGWSDPPSGTVS